MTSLQRRQAVCFSSSVPSAHPYSPQNQEDQRKGGQRNPPGEAGGCGKKGQVRVKRSHQIGQCVRVWGQRATEGGSSHKCALSFRVCVPGTRTRGVGGWPLWRHGNQQREQHFIPEKRQSEGVPRPPHWAVRSELSSRWASARNHEEAGLALPFPNDMDVMRIQYSHRGKKTNCEKRSLGVEIVAWMQLFYVQLPAFCVL